MLQPYRRFSSHVASKSTLSIPVSRTGGLEPFMSIDTELESESHGSEQDADASGNVLERPRSMSPTRSTWFERKLDHVLGRVA